MQVNGKCMKGKCQTLEQYNFTKRHIFAVSAYKKSPYLRACIKSLLAQSVKSDIIICTSTPNSYIKDIADEFNIRLYIRQGIPCMAKDWNFACKKAGKGLVTIAHQDDLYCKDYVKTLLFMKERYPDMGLFTTASIIIKGGSLIDFGEANIIKKILRLPLRLKWFSHTLFIKRLSISFGNPVICPSCTYDKDIYGDLYFNPTYNFVLDWDMLLRLSSKKGRWICIEKPLIMYRIHDDSATKRSIADSSRTAEESVMFDRLLPYPVSQIIKRAYRRAHNAYL